MSIGMVPTRNKKKLSLILFGVLLVTSCNQFMPGALPPATPAPASQPPQPAQTQTLTPAPTLQPFVFPGGRLLLAAGWKPEVPTPEQGVPLFTQFRWLSLPDMAVSPHPYLTGEFPVSDMDGFVSLSPDRTHLVFGRATWSFIETGGQRFPSPTSISVFLSDPDGSRAIEVGQFNGAGERLYQEGCADGFSWSADSRFVAFARTSDWTSFEKLHHLYVYGIESGTLRTVAIHSQQELGVFALSPHGSQIAFTELEGYPDIALNLHLVNVDGSNDRLLVPGWITSNLVWHPDGTRVFFINDRPELGIYSADVATGMTTLIVPVGDQAGCLGLSPDGRVLTYDNYGIWAVDLDGGDPRQLATYGQGSGRYLVWSPDGQYIAWGFSQKLHINDRAGSFQTIQTLDYHEDDLEPLYPIGWLP